MGGEEAGEGEAGVIGNNTTASSRPQQWEKKNKNKKRRQQRQNGNAVSMRDGRETGRHVGA